MGSMRGAVRRWTIISQRFKRSRQILARFSGITCMLKHFLIDRSHMGRNDGRIEIGVKGP